SLIRLETPELRGGRYLISGTCPSPSGGFAATSTQVGRSFLRVRGERRRLVQQLPAPVDHVLQLLLARGRAAERGVGQGGAHLGLERVPLRGERSDAVLDRRVVAVIARAAACDRVRRRDQGVVGERSERSRDVLVHLVQAHQRLVVGAQVPRDRRRLQEVGQDRAIGLVAVLQPEEREHRRTRVGVVGPRVARASQVLDARAHQTEPGAAYVIGRVAVAPGEVIVDAGGNLAARGVAYGTGGVGGGQEVVRVGG